jgi:hypothetical protein
VELQRNGKTSTFDLLARAHLCPRHSSEFQKKRKIKRKKLFFTRQKRNERRRNFFEERPMCVGPNKRKEEKKSGKIK